MATGRESTGIAMYVQRAPARPRKRGPKSGRPTLLTLAILTVGARTATELYPAFGLVRDDSLTLLGRAVWPLLALASIVAMHRRPMPFRLPARPLLVVIAAVIVSTLWSADAPRTAYQSVVLASIAVSTTYVLTRHDARRCFLIVAGCLGTVCALNAAAALAGMGDPLRRGGLMEHKNLLGALSAASVLACALASRSTRGRTRRWFVAAAIAAAGVRSGDGAARGQQHLAQQRPGDQRHHHLHVDRLRRRLPGHPDRIAGAVEDDRRLQQRSVAGQQLERPGHPAGTGHRDQVAPCR